MRIAWTGPIGNGGGVPRMGLLILEELLRQGVEVDLYTPSYGFEELPIGPTPGLRIIERRSGWTWGRWYSRTKEGAMVTGTASRTISHFLLSLRLLREHYRHPYDVVYQLSITELFLLGRLRRFAPPIVVHPCTHHGGELRWHRAEEAYALQSEPRAIHRVMRAFLVFRSRLQPGELARADLVLGLSNRFNQLLHEDYGVPEDKLGVVRTPVELDRFTPYGPTVPLNKRTLLFISRISTRKGVEEIIQLSHRLADLSDSVRLLVIGGPTQWSDYTAHLKRLNPAVAEFLGGVENDALPALLRSAAMLLVPSRYEPGSIATAEALGCGLPVVLSDEVGAGEVVEGPHVRFHRAGDIDGLEHAVRSMLAALEADRATIAAAARANAEEQFAPNAVVGQLADYLATASRGRGAREAGVDVGVPALEVEPVIPAPTAEEI
jgi:glycosyltransferase involved in cell wall biosynthesis